ncbi:methyl-accepting chemotaxis protein [Natronoarchaeum mannanilyticum]|uniref:methyl-accepting chemotaxis protein n=1 Tax=Natronoarchaeum mannanilyticum TaxID=926360 RepID=UPI00361BF890
MLKFAVAFAFVMLIIGCVGAIGYSQTQGTVEQNTENQLTSTAKLQADSMGEWVEGMRRQTILLSEGEAVQDGNAESIDAYVSTKKSSVSLEMKNIHYVDASDGSVVASTREGYDGRELSNVSAPWGQQSFYDQLSRHSSVAITNSSYYSGAFSGRVIAFASPVRSQEDGYIVTVGRAEQRVQGLYQPIEGGETVIINGNNEQVLSNGSADQAYTSVESDGDETTAQFERRNDEVIAYTEVPGTDWTVITSTPTSQAFAVRNEVGLNILAMLAVALLGLALTGVVLGRHTVVPIQRLQRKTAEMENGNLDIDLATDRDDEIGHLFAGFKNMRDALREQISEARKAREDAEAARAETEQMNEHLETKANEYRSIMDDAAAGDLTVRMDPESKNDAMSQIGRTFNEMLGEIEATTEQLKNFAGEVATASEQVTASSEEVRSASEQVTESIQEISDGAERQNDSLLTVSSEMDGLSTTTEQIAASSNEVADLAERTAQTGQEGREAAQQAIEGMNSIKAESEGTVTEIEQLQEEVAQIDELLEFITEMANQTNMLALNANIEASRSANGEDSGFGAVAEEVKELATDTKDAAEDIEARLEQIKNQTDTTTTEVRKTSNEIAEHTDSVLEAADALEEIAGYAQETNTGVQEISAATQQQAAATQQVVAMVDEAATISEETTTEAENVAAAAEEQTTALTEVSRSASDLATQASQLSEALDRFDTDAHDRKPSQQLTSKQTEEKVTLNRDNTENRTDSTSADVEGETRQSAEEHDAFSFAESPTKSRQSDKKED